MSVTISGTDGVSKVAATADKQDTLVSGTNIKTINSSSLLGSGDVEAYAKNNILGTVSQSGGVPTGAIIEQGSNANGEYIKYADGTMICRVKDHQLSFDTVNKLSAGWGYPVAFLSRPTLVLSEHYNGAISINANDTVRHDACCFFEGGSNTYISANYYKVSGFSSGDSIFVDIIALGRWF